jgi:hypothetical protein
MKKFFKIVGVLALLCVVGWGLRLVFTENRFDEKPDVGWGIVRDNPIKMMR